ncbi:MAG: ThiF family adenylyltransferase [bacterium]|nr:ThiF family adenylyltransferase [bacterium]
MAETDRIATIDPTRHLLQFDPHVFDDTRVDVVGCGAVGGKVGDLIARYGVRNLHLHDGDRVSGENIANQSPFTQADIGRMKVEALADHLVAAGCARPTLHPRFIEGPTPLGRVVFLAVDKMRVRKAIFAHSLHLKLSTDYVIEVRMGIDELRVYGFNPRDRGDVEQWRASLYDDDEAVEGVCQMPTTVGDTASITAGVAVARFRHWFRREVARDTAYAKPLPVEQIFMLRPLLAMAQ